MKKNSIAKCAFIALALAILQPEACAEVESPRDPVSTRVLEFYGKYGHHVDAPMYPKDHSYWSDLQWYRDKGSAVRPALMYLLTTEYRADYEKMSDVVSALATAPGDQNALLEFVRSELAKQPKTRPSGYSSFLARAMSVLSRYGDSSDLPLIEAFELDDDPRVRLSAESQARNFAKRMAERPDGPERPPRNPEERDRRESARTDPPAAEGSESDSDGDGQIRSRYAVWCAAGILLVALLIYVAVRHRGS